MIKEMQGPKNPLFESGKQFPTLDTMYDVMCDNILEHFPEYQNASLSVDNVNQTDMFSQTWDDTKGGFSKPGESGDKVKTKDCITIFTATVDEGDGINSNIFYGVFFGNKPAYLVYQPSGQFFADLKNRHLRTVYKAQQLY